MPEDVTLLAQRKIIVHHLDSDDKLSDLLTLLSKDVVFDFNGNYYLKSLPDYGRSLSKPHHTGGWHGCG
jgi:hypothetical protein